MKKTILTGISGHLFNSIFVVSSSLDVFSYHKLPQGGGAQAAPLFSAPDLDRSSVE